MTASFSESIAPACESASFSVENASTAIYNEACDLTNILRPHWTEVMNSVSEMGVEGMENRLRQAQRILRDDGATYNLNGDPLSPNVWSLDIIPTLLAEGEWATVERGLAQRSLLFDLILKDLYGEQRLLKEGIIPSEIVFSHPGFLRQCHGILLPGAHNLIFHAVDLVRGGNGQFVAIGDRTQAPSGTGYVLENRIAVSRVLPSLFRNSHVRRLSGFFHALRHTLASLASHKTDTPRIVVLTPGAYSSTYFEHAYLANYLGFQLVQGGDLTVRNGRVWLKSLNGLSEVDVILRRMDDTYCDQTELRSDSRLGVPGLLEVVRNGNVVLANPLGSGVLEAPALLAFMPEMSHFLLGEPLLIPTVKTWWCGRAEDRDFVIHHLDQLIIKPSYRSFDSKSIYGHSLDDAGRKLILQQITASPHSYVAQAYIPGSRVPVWANQQIEYRPTIFRAFTVAAPEGYCVMPGTLSRVAESADEFIVSDLSGARSKDTWILGESFDTVQPLLTDSIPRDEGNLPSRVIENLFWFGRYAERAEMSLRLIRILFKQLNGVEQFMPESREILLGALSALTGTFPESDAVGDQNHELSSLVCDGQRAGSIKFNILNMLACGEQVKEMLSADTRIIINELRDYIRTVEVAYQDGLPELPEESLDNLVTSLLALSGLSHESMLRGMDWRFQEIGRRAERARLTAILLKHTLTRAVPGLQQQQILESVLMSVEALISFRRRYRGQMNIISGLDLLMLDGTNPRSLIYQVDRLRKYLLDLPRLEGQTSSLTSDMRPVMKSLTDIQLADLDLLAQVDEQTGLREQLDTIMTQIISQLEQFTTLLSDKYFDHANGPQQLINTQWKTDL